MFNYIYELLYKKKQSYITSCEKTGLVLNDHIGEYFVRIEVVVMFRSLRSLHCLQLFLVEEDTGKFQESLSKNVLKATLLTKDNRSDYTEDMIKGAVKEYFKYSDTYLLKGDSIVKVDKKVKVLEFN